MLLHPVSQKFHQRCLWNSASVRLSDDGPLSSFLSSCQRRSSSASSFHASLLQAIDGVMTLANPQQITRKSTVLKSHSFRSWNLAAQQQIINRTRSYIYNYTMVKGRLVVSCLLYCSLNFMCVCFLFLFCLFYEPAKTTTKLPLVGWLKFFLIELNRSPNKMSMVLYCLMRHNSPSHHESTARKGVNSNNTTGFSAWNSHRNFPQMVDASRPIYWCRLWTS